METPDLPNRIKLGRRVLSSVSPTSYLEVTDAQALKRPCVIVLGGTENNTDRDANALAKRVKHMLGRYRYDDEDIAMYMGTYPADGNANARAAVFYNEAVSRGLVEDYYKKEGRRRYQPGTEARQFVHEFLLPLIATDITSQPGQALQATPLPIETAKRNLRNINFVAHSYGTKVVQQIGDQLAEMIFQLHHDDKIVEELTRQVSVLSVGDVTAVDKPRNPAFTTLHILNLDDELLDLYHTGNKSLGRDLFKNRDLDTYHTLDLDSLALAKVAGTDNRWIAVAKSLPPMQRAMRNDKKLGPDHSQHEFETYAMLGHPELPSGMNLSTEGTDQLSFSNAFMLPILAASFLRNSVDNSVRNKDVTKDFEPLPEMKDLARCKGENELAFALSPSFDAAPYHNLDSIARGVGYGERMEALITPGGPTATPGPTSYLFGR